MIAVDTNILVYAHRKDSVFHDMADQKLTWLAESGQAWAIAWPCLHEFLAIVTHSRIYKPPTPLDRAIRQVEHWLECPTLHCLGEMGDYFGYLAPLLALGRITGAHIHDARVMALCLQNSVTTLWSADRDFSRMEGVPLVNPLIES